MEGNKTRASVSKRKLEAGVLKVKRAEANLGKWEVTAENLAEKITKQFGVEIAPEAIDVKSPLRQYGTHTVPVQLSDALRVDLRVQVEKR